MATKAVVMNEVHDALKTALGEAQYKKIIPESIQVDGDDIRVQIAKPPLGPRVSCISLSTKTVKWSQG